MTIKSGDYFLVKKSFTIDYIYEQITFHAWDELVVSRELHYKPEIYYFTSSITGKTGDFTRSQIEYYVEKGFISVCSKVRKEKVGHPLTKIFT
jgi:hypothetical protein